VSLPHRRALLTVALAAALLDTQGQPEPPEQTMVREWLDSWTGVGQVVTGMARQGYRLHLTNVEPGVWRATFFGGPMFEAEGFGTGETPWRAVQVAAWEVVGRAKPISYGS
jgi:hypothetical protein